MRRLIFAKRVAGIAGPRSWAALLAGGCLVASCAAPADLSAISLYSRTTAASATSFAAVAADFDASCERYRSVLQGLIEPAETAQKAAIVVSQTPGLAAFLLPGARPGPGYVYSPSASASASTSAASGAASSAPVTVSADSNCDDAAEVSAAWQQANGTILAYVQALGHLADVDAVPTANPAPLATGLTKAGVAAPAVQAVSTLVRTMSSYFATHAQSAAISDFLASVNEPLPGAIEALEVTDASYTIELKNEFSRTASQYATFVRTELRARDALPERDSRRRNACNQRLAQTKGSVEAALTSIDRHLRASRDYGTALEGILATHHALYEKSRSRASLPDYVKIIRTTGAPVFTSLQALANEVH